MKKLLSILAMSCITLPAFSNPAYNNTTMPNFNWGNNNSNWNMPNMNWGNNGYNNGSNWNMPSFNWGNNQGNSGWNMPSFNWGNNNGYGNGSSWSMPTMNWGNNGYNNGSNWNMPSFNWSNNNQPWNFGNGFNNGYGYNNQFVNPQTNMMRPQIQQSTPKAPQFIPPKMPKLQNAPASTKQSVSTTMKAPVANQNSKTTAENAVNKIPTPSEVKGVILAPANKPKIEVDTSKESK